MGTGVVPSEHPWKTSTAPKIHSCQGRDPCGMEEHTHRGTPCVWREPFHGSVVIRTGDNAVPWKWKYCSGSIPALPLCPHPTAAVPMDPVPGHSPGQSFPGPAAAQQPGKGSEKGRIQFISHCTLSSAPSQAVPWPSTETSLISP